MIQNTGLRLFLGKFLSRRSLQPLFEGSEFSTNANEASTGMELGIANAEEQPTMKGTRRPGKIRPGRALSSRAA